jgi:hypothetical protein
VPVVTITFREVEEVTVSDEDSSERIYEWDETTGDAGHKAQPPNE